MGHVYVENYFCRVSSTRPVGGQRGTLGILTQLPRNARRGFFFKHMPEDVGW